jgi:hypothetical protein
MKKLLLGFAAVLLFTSCYTYRIKKAAESEYLKAYDLQQQSFCFLMDSTRYNQIYVEQLLHAKKSDSLFTILCTIKRKDGIIYSLFKNTYDTCK